MQEWENERTKQEKTHSLLHCRHWIDAHVWAPCQSLNDLWVGVSFRTISIFLDLLVTLAPPCSSHRCWRPWVPRSSLIVSQMASQRPPGASCHLPVSLTRPKEHSRRPTRPPRPTCLKSYSCSKSVPYWMMWWPTCSSIMPFWAVRVAWSSTRNTRCDANQPSPFSPFLETIQMDVRVYYRQPFLFWLCL